MTRYESSMKRSLYSILSIPEKLVTALVSGFWRFLNGLRRFVANLFFLMLLIGLIFVFVAEKRTGLLLPVKGGLLINPKGVVVEQLSYANSLDELYMLSTDGPQEILLSEFLQLISRAKSDSNITAIVLQPGGLVGTGISKINAIGEALLDFKQSGKPVIAVGDYYSQMQYLLASYADEIYLHPMGGIELKGLSIYRTYYKEALDKLAVDYHVFRVGAYKSALEPYLRNDMSPEAKQANNVWLTDLWRSYTQTVSQQRGISVAGIDQYVNQQDELLVAQNGDVAKTALAASLVDGIKTRPEQRRYLIEKLGGNDDETNFKHVKFSDYLGMNHLFTPLKSNMESYKDKQVGVIIAKGEIVDGRAPPGAIGGDSLAELIRQARTKQEIKTLVLRIDSPGGSVFASQVISDELALFRQSGKPLVVSMGSVAASGGYWISTDADQIWAEPDTITGSIGVYGALPSLARSLTKIGLHNDGVGTSRLSGAYQLERPLSDYAARIAQLEVENVYRQFVQRVAVGRKMSDDQVAAVAQGRVWTGRLAHANGLVDKLGGLQNAIEAAAELAGLKEYSQHVLQRKLSPREQILRQLNSIRFDVYEQSVENAWLSAISALIKEFKILEQMNDPKGLYSYCVACKLFQ